MVSIVQAEFLFDTLSEKSIWKMVVLVTKGGGRDFRGIGLVEVLWKTVTGLLNHRFTSEIRFHDFIHGFWADRGTGTSTLKAKLIQHLTSMRGVVLYNISPVIQTAYNSLDRDRCLEIFAEYGVSPRALQLLRTYLGRLTMVARAGG